MLRTILAACLLCAVALGDEPSPKLKKAIEAGERHREKVIAAIKQTITDKKKSVVEMKKRKIEAGRGAVSIGKDKAGGRTYTFTSKEAKAKAIADGENTIEEKSAELKAIQTAKYVAPRMNVQSLKVDDIGIVTNDQGQELVVKIQQVIDADNMMVTSTTVGRERLWLTMPTAGLVDGKSLTLDKTMEVTGTRQYTTVAGGSKTVFVLVPFEFPSD